MLLDLYDYASDRTQTKEWFTFLDVPLGASVEDDGTVYLWFQEDTSVEETFDITTYSSPQGFIQAVEKWINTEK